MQIRPLTTTDLDTAIEIANQLPTAPHWPRSAYESALTTRITLAAIQNTELTGFAIAQVLFDEAELESIAVAPTHQRQGIAQTLLNALIEQLRQQNIHTLTLEVRASNHPAIQLYQRAGFTETARRPNYYSHPDEDALLFALSLVQP